jgi:hypothetical protein
VGVTVLVLISGNPAVFVLPKQAVYIAALAFFIGAWTRVGSPLRRSDGFVLAAFSVLSLFHLAVFGSDVLTTSAGFLVRLVIAMFAVRAFEDFDDRYVDVMLGIAVISLLFHVPIQLNANLVDATAPLRVPIEGMLSRHIGIHNFMVPGEEGRNAGMLGEPGMFAGYIVLALILATVAGIKRRILTWLVLVVTLLSTRSTMGYVAGVAACLLASYSIPARSRLLAFARGAALSIVFIAGAVLAYEQVEFLGEKIEHQWEEALEGTEPSRINRFGNLLYDLEYVQEHPIIGWSPLPLTRSSKDSAIEELVTGQGNGLSNFAVKFGVTGLALYFVLMYRGFKRRGANALLALGACVVIAMTLTGEPYLNGPAFMTLMFMRATPRSNRVTVRSAGLAAR